MRKYLSKVCLAVTLMASVTIMVSCSKDNAPKDGGATPSVGKEYVLVLNQGNYESNNGRISYYDYVKGSWDLAWFRTVNSKALGDTPVSIIRAGDNLFAIAVNHSGIVQFIDKEGKDCGSVEVPNCRQICYDGKDNIYVTSYAHQLGDKTFTKGFVAKISTSSKSIVGSCEVGWEPEGIAYYNGKLYVANSGGYTVGYDTTLSIVNADNMTIVKTVNTDKVNLYGGFSQMDNYLCINAAEVYGQSSPAVILFDCNTDAIVTTFDFGGSYIINDGVKFYAVDYSLWTGLYSFNTITPNTASCESGFINSTIEAKIKSLTALYALYYSKDNDYIYFTDAMDYATAGYLYCYDKDGNVIIDKATMHISPGAILTYTK